MEESAMNLRRSFALLSNNTITNNSNMYGGFGFKSAEYNHPLHRPHPSVSSVSQLLLDANSAVAGGGGSFRGSLPTFPPLYSSLPPVPVHRQPPLLPLPVKSAILPSTSKKIGTGTAPVAIARSSSTAATSSAARQNNNHKRRRKKKQQQAKPSTSPKKEPAAAAAAKPIKNKMKEEEEETEEEFLLKPLPPSPSVYSLSPPPSSLPLPRLLLLRPRPRTTAKVAPAESCNAEARGVATVSGDAGVTSDLRKILRL